MNIPKNAYVLEIGPGGHPHPRSDIFLEKFFDSEEIATAQRGFSNLVTNGKNIVYYNGGKFPFNDKEFDYVICSHVIEHIPISDLSEFISEMQRVGKAGFIEFPTVFYELINYQPVHIWLMNLRGDEILFLDKRVFHSNNVHKIYRMMFYGKDVFLSRLFSRYRELFFSYVHWENKVIWKIVDSWDDLINTEDVSKFNEYFSNFTMKKTLNVSWHLKLIKLCNVLYLKFFKCMRYMKRVFNIL